MSRARRRTTRLRWVLGLTGVVVVATIGFTGWQALKARDALTAVAADFETLAGQLREGDQPGAGATLRDAQKSAAVAYENTRGPGWLVTGWLPGVGDDIRAVRTVADVTDRLADEVLPPVVDASGRLDPSNLRPRNGRIDLEPIAAVAPEVVRADRALQAQAGRVAAIDVAELNPTLADPIVLMGRKLDEAAGLSAKASAAVRLLPSMLGADGERTYLLLFQNNAEVRATGGIPGAYATIAAEDGRIRIVDQGSAGAFGRLERPVTAITAEETSLFHDQFGLFAQNLTSTPEFSRTGEIAQALWEDERGTPLDGVLSADPVALSYLLRGTGPVEVARGRKLTADNAVSLLLNDIYRVQPDPAAQDAFFAKAARSVFDAVAAGRGDAKAVLEGLTQAGVEGRLLAWSADAAEQRIIADTALGGNLPAEPGPRPFVGVFLNDATAAKMQYYLDYEVDVQPVQCNVEDRQVLEVTVTMRSTAPEDAASLPSYVTGTLDTIEPGDQRVNVLLYTPLNGFIETAAVDGQESDLFESEHSGHAVGVRTIGLAPGQERTLTYTVATGTDMPGAPRVRVTPGVHGTGVGALGGSACA